MQSFVRLGALLLAFSAVFSLAGDDEPTRKEHYNLKKKTLAIQGYDPISFFMGGAEKGKKSITAEHHGVTYHFANEANKATFEGNPEKYEPAYGGWCATAMLTGDRVSINPKFYKIVDGKLLLFYKGLLGNALKSWEDMIADGGVESDLVSKAETVWQESLN